MSSQLRQLSYDKTVEYLTKHPEEINDAWMSPNAHPAGRLFVFRSLGNYAACLTMMKCDGTKSRQSEAAEVVADLLADPDFPTSDEFVGEHDAPTWPLEKRLAALPKFAEYQKRFDAALVEST